MPGVRIEAAGLQLGRGGLVTDGENAMVFSSQGPDMLIYCSSEAFDEDTVERLGGACVEITDPQSFFNALDAALRAQLEIPGRSLGVLQCGWCTYTGRSHSWEQTELPSYWLLKPRENYAHQREFRSAWDFRRPQPTIVESAAIAAACRRIR